MKSTILTQAVEDAVNQKLDAAEIVLKELIEPISDVGNPEKLINKNYDAWTSEDLQMLTQIYGSGEKTPLSNLIFRRIFERVKEMEKEELSV